MVHRRPSLQLYDHRYIITSDRALLREAWPSAVLDASPELYFQNARDVHKKINVLLWVGREEPKDWGWISGKRKGWLYPLRRGGRAGRAAGPEGTVCVEISA